MKLKFKFKFIKFQKIKDGTSTSPKISTQLSTSGSSDINVESGSLPGSVPASPRSVTQAASPRTPQMSPRASTPQMSPKGSPKVAPPLGQTQSSPRGGAAATLLSLQGGQKAASASITPVSSPSKPSVVQMMPSQQNKPVSVTFLQPQAGPRLVTPSGTMVLPNSQNNPRPVLAGSKPITFNLIQAQTGSKVIENVGQGQKLMTIPQVQGLQPQIVTVPNPLQPDNVAQRQVVTSGVSLVPNSPKHAITPTAPKPRTVQQVAAPQTVTMGSIASALTTPPKHAVAQGTTSIKIQGMLTLYVIGTTQKSLLIGGGGSDG